MREREEVVVCGGIRQGGVDVERELRRAPWAYRVFGRVLVDVLWFLVNPRDRLQGDPASRLVHFVSDTRPRCVIAQILGLSASLFRSSTLSPSLSHSLYPPLLCCSPSRFYLSRCFHLSIPSLCLSPSIIRSSHIAF